MDCKMLKGENVVPRTASDARKLIGKRVEYLRTRDIDQSGRGYIFPQRGTIVGVLGRNIAIDHEHNYEYLTKFVEMVILPEVADERP